MTLTISAILFAVFAANVLLGAVTGSPVLGDVSEMLVLFAASIAFVAEILRREARAEDDRIARGVDFCCVGIAAAAADDRGSALGGPNHT